ncbi:MAG: hypothetical protein ABJG68_14285 [Crocinitomicaceae bacterium]
MGKLTTVDIILAIVFIGTAIAVLVISYMLFIRRFRRAKMVTLNDMKLITSQKNYFQTKTKFLVENPECCEFKIELKDMNDNCIAVLADELSSEVEYPFDFDPAQYEKGKYYLYLTSENVKIQRIITIA